MRRFVLALIFLYQRFISPNKGFRCAHHALYGGGSCSGAVAEIVRQHGLFRGWPRIRRRFSDCRAAYETLSNQRTCSSPLRKTFARIVGLPRADLSCDFPCEMSCSSSVFGAGSDLACSMPCDLLQALSRKNQRRLFFVFVVLLIFCGYWFYGRGVGSVYLTLTDSGGGKQGLVERFTQRDNPELRLVLTEDGEKYYSNVVKVTEQGETYRFAFENSPLGVIDSMKVLDGRVALGENTLVLSQVLERFDHPKKTGSGKRFTYRIKRRWHLF